jgi:hypothetical protein
VLPEGRLRPTALAEAGALTTEDADGNGSDEDLACGESADSRTLHEAQNGADDSGCYPHDDYMGCYPHDDYMGCYPHDG